MAWVPITGSDSDMTNTALWDELFVTMNNGSKQSCPAVHGGLSNHGAFAGICFECTILKRCSIATKTHVYCTHKAIRGRWWGLLCYKVASSRDFQLLKTPNIWFTGCRGRNMYGKLPLWAICIRFRITGRNIRHLRVAQYGWIFRASKPYWLH